MLIAFFSIAIIGGILWMLKNNNRTNHVVVNSGNEHEIPMDSSFDNKLLVESDYSLDNINLSNNELKNLLIDKIGQWDMGHDLGETYRLFSLYANRVYFYGELCSRETIIEKLDDLLNKEFGFTQRSYNIDVTQLSNTSVRCDFDKHTFQADGRKGNYPSYLRFENIDGDWLIVEESDAITDKNLRKRKTKSQ